LTTKKTKNILSDDSNSKSNYLICKTSFNLKNRLKKAASIEKRSISNLVCIIVELWLDDNEI